jgi:hypothetical protein
MYRARVDPTLRRRIAAGLLIAGIAVAGLAIADVGPFSDPITEQERAKQAVEEFYAAAAAGDGRRFCGLLTAEARNTLEVNTAQRLQIDRHPGCEQVLKLLKAAFADSEIDVRYVNVSGNRARAEARYEIAGHGSQPRTVLLQEEDGEWRISDPG